MGNCIRHDVSKVQWGGENWESALALPTTTETKREEKLDNLDLEEEKLGGQGGRRRRRRSRTDQVKVKITKKQLEELLGENKIDLQGSSSVKQVLYHLMMNFSADEIQNRSWRPRLQSIPEQLALISLI
ncbi:hypothetical protein Dimus_012503 [Dionaea muscipula]